MLWRFWLPKYGNKSNNLSSALTNSKKSLLALSLQKFFSNIKECREECYLNLNRSSHSQVFFKIIVRKNFANFTGTPVLKVFLQTCNFIKKGLQHRCFPVKFAKFLRTNWALLVTAFVWNAVKSVWEIMKTPGFNTIVANF